MSSPLATVTVSITNKNPEVEGGPFTDSIDVAVYASAGTFLSFLNDDQNGGSGYHDFWLQVPDNNLSTCPVTTSSIRWAHQPAIRAVANNGV